MAQVRVVASRHCDVVALVNSTTWLPESSQWKTSGIIKKRFAWANSSGLACCMAINWYSVLIVMNCSPVAEKISRRETRENARSMTPCVRMSR